MVEDDVLHDGSEHARRAVYIGLRLLRELYDFGIAPALKVEDSVVRPAMLVVANQPPLGVCAQGCLARARKPEEDCNVARVAYVRRAVHRHHAALRQKVVENRKYRLLRLARVTG